MPLPVSWLALGALASVLALIWALAAAARRFGLAPAARAACAGGVGLAVAASVALDPRRRAVLLRCGGGHVLVLTGGPQDLLLGWVGDAPVAGPVPHPAPQQVLRPRVKPGHDGEGSGA